MINKIPVFIATYNRINITERSLKSLYNSNIPDYIEIVVNDDGSNPNDLSVIESLCKEYKWTLNKFEHLGLPVGSIARINPQLVDYDKPYFFITDSDILYTKNWIQTLTKLYEQQKTLEKVAIVTGFNTSANTHQIFNIQKGYGYKKTVGGANLLVDASFYRNFPRGWCDEFDWVLSRYANENSYSLISSYPSIVEHIGINGVHGTGDVSDDFPGEFFDSLSIFTI